MIRHPRPRKEFRRCSHILSSTYPPLQPLLSATSMCPWVFYTIRIYRDMIYETREHKKVSKFPISSQNAYIYQCIDHPIRQQPLNIPRSRREKEREKFKHQTTITQRYNASLRDIPETKKKCHKTKKETKTRTPRVESSSTKPQKRKEKKTKKKKRNQTTTRIFPARKEENRGYPYRKRRKKETRSFSGPTSSHLFGFERNSPRKKMK